MGRQLSELIGDLVNEIDVELAYIDKVRVRAACVSWNSLLSKMPNHKLPQLPWLLQTIVDNEGRGRRSHGLFNLSDKKFYQLDLPELQGKLLRGSSHGWLVMLYLEDDYNNITTTTTRSSNPNICLINPLTGFQIQLPPRSTFPDVVNYFEDRLGEEYFLKSRIGQKYDQDYHSAYHVLIQRTVKFITSGIPSSKDFVVVAIYSELGKLAWCSPGHNKWTPLEIYSGTNNFGPPIEDIIFSNNKLYAINSDGTLFEVENIGPNPKVKIIIEVPDLVGVPHQATIVPRGDYKCLVECSDGSLIMIDVFFSYEDETIGSFEAYKINSDNSCWRLVNDIGNDMVFMGYNLSFSISASQFPGYRGNCIYFTDSPGRLIYFEDNPDDRERYADIGIFNLEDRSIERIPGFSTVLRSLWPRPIWVTQPIYN